MWRGAGGAFCITSEVVTWCESKKAGPLKTSINTGPTPPTSFPSCLFILLPITSFIHTSTLKVHIFILHFRLYFHRWMISRSFSTFMTMKLWMGRWFLPALHCTWKADCRRESRNQDIMERRSDSNFWCSRYLLGRACGVVLIEGIESYIYNRISLGIIFEVVNSKEQDSGKRVKIEKEALKYISALRLLIMFWTQLCQHHTRP